MQGRLREYYGVAEGPPVASTLDHIVAAVAGWVTSRSNRPLSVVVVVNRPGAQYGSGQAVIDTVVRWALDR